MNGPYEPDIGERIRRVMADSRLTRTQFCAQLKIASSTLANYLAGKRLPDVKLLIRLAKYFDVNLHWLLLGDKPIYNRDGGVRQKTLSTGEEVVQIPAISPRLSDWKPGDEPLPQGKVSNYFCFNFGWLSAQGAIDNMLLTYVSGDAMRPQLEDGDMVLVDGARSELLAGKLFAVIVEGMVLVRRVEVGIGALRFTCANPSYGAIEVRPEDREQVHVLGRVIWAGRHIG